MKSDRVKPNRRAARPMRGSRAKAYPRDELLAATIAHAEATITKARGVGPHENELAMFRNYAMSHANFEQTEQAEKMARRANSDLSKGYNLLLKGI